MIEAWNRCSSRLANWIHFPSFVRMGWYPSVAMAVGVKRTGASIFMRSG